MPPKSLFYVILFMVGTMILESCTKNYYFGSSPCATPTAGAPSITSFSPLTGPKNTTVTITGANFSPSAANNSVSFNGIKATVISATATTLTVSVTKGAGDGKISVSTGGPTVTSANDFQYQYTVTTFAGDTIPGFANGVGSAARFSSPYGVAIDPNGDLIVTDAFNSRIRKITPAGVVSSIDSSATGLQIPIGLTIDAAGNIYVADANNHRIRKITAAGAVSTLAGGIMGFADGQGANAKFNFPFEVVVDAAGNAYVTDSFNERIRKITSTGLVSTLAGNGTAGYVNGTAANAEFFNPVGMTIDGAGNLYVADADNNLIRKITPGGIVSTFAGNGTRGYADGTAANAQFSFPTVIKLDAAGNMYISDSGNNVIRRITPAGVVSTIAGSTRGHTDGVGTNARFYAPRGIALDGAGNIYVADLGNNCIRKLD